jgi:hypothetical protein
MNKFKLKKLGKEECEFMKLSNGRIVCKTHKSAILYLFSSGNKICQQGEDIMVGK